MLEVKISVSEFSGDTDSESTRFQLDRGNLSKMSLQYSTVQYSRPSTEQHLLRSATITASGRLQPGPAVCLGPCKVFSSIENPLSSLDGRALCRQVRVVLKLLYGL